MLSNLPKKKNKIKQQTKVNCSSHRKNFVNNTKLGPTNTFALAHHIPFNQHYSIFLFSIINYKFDVNVDLQKVDQ